MLHVHYRLNVKACVPPLLKEQRKYDYLVYFEYYFFTAKFRSTRPNDTLIQSFIQPLSEGHTKTQIIIIKNTYFVAKKRPQWQSAEMKTRYSTFTTQNVFLQNKTFTFSFAFPACFLSCWMHWTLLHFLIRKTLAVDEILSFPFAVFCIPVSIYSHRRRSSTHYHRLPRLQPLHPETQVYNHEVYNDSSFDIRPLLMKTLDWST